MKRNYLFLILLFALLVNPFSVLFKNQSSYFSKGYNNQYESLKKAYYSSQYVNKHPTGSMPDETLEAFAGGIFLHGLNPILIVHDQPPLGRYIIALSILIFDNEKTIPVLLLIISAIGIYLISLQVLKNNFLALIPFGLFINAPMFLNKFSYIPLLEPIQFPFILFALYTFIIGIQKKRYAHWFVMTGLLIGFVISIRYFILGIVLASSFLLYLLLHKKIKMSMILTSSLLMSLMILLISYFQTFKAGYSLIKILGIQKYIFFYHKSAFAQPFSYWDLLLFNKWHTWWENNAVLSDAEWSILWPIAAAVIVLFVVFALFKKVKLNQAEIVLLLWVTLYSMMLSVGYTSTRYFLPLIPFLYILATSFIVKLLLYSLGIKYVGKNVSKK